MSPCLKQGDVFLYKSKSKIIFAYIAHTMALLIVDNNANSIQPLPADFSRASSFANKIAPIINPTSGIKKLIKYLKPFPPPAFLYPDLLYSLFS